MKYFSRNALACLMLLIAGNGINACELPAHPNAAAMPVSITPKGGNSEISIKEAGDLVKLVPVDDLGNFYYLIPEGSRVKMKIVWDPLCHNSGATGKEWDNKKEQYDYVADGHIDGVNKDPDVEPVGGFAFFPLSAMTNFFKVTGNRNDIKEAFQREMKVPLENAIVEDLLFDGPGKIYHDAFYKSSTELIIEVTETKSSNYPDEGAVKPKIGEYQDTTDDLNDALPGTHKNWPINDKDVYLLENDKLVLQKIADKKGFSAAKIENSEDVIVYSKSGIEVNEPKIELKERTAKEYKAYIEKNENGKEIHVRGLDYNPSYNPDDAKNIDKDGFFYVTFTTPTIDGEGNEDNAVLKVKVNAPAAGYEMSNAYWVWQEQYYERVKEDKEYPVDGDSSKKYKCSDDTIYVFKKKDKLKKCSCETKVTFNKSADPVGYAGYKIYDNCGPISTLLELTDEKDKQVFAEKENEIEKTTLKYKISFIDSNPFLAKEIKATAKENELIGDNQQINVVQNTDNMKVTFFYNYPVYDYKLKEIAKIDSAEDLKKCGLIDFASEEDKKEGYNSKFKTYEHDVKWFWKKAVDVKVDSLKEDGLITEDGSTKGRLIGSKATIEGSFTIDNPKPWHVADNVPAHITNNFAVFAVLKDTAGKTHLTTIYNAKSTETSLQSADPTNFKTNNAVYPNEGETIEIDANDQGGDAPSLAENIKTQSGWSNTKWQEKKLITSADKTAPEIQVIVLDTRTNRYHIFGTKANVAAEFNKFGSTTDTDYAEKYKNNQIPYIGKNTAISESYHYTTLDDLNSLYEKYLKETKSVSTIEVTNNKNGFVCQKGSRLVFYAHAFDNIGYQEGSDLNDFKIKLVDEINNHTEERTNGDPLEYVFRQENYDKDGNKKQDKSYKLIVSAKDKSNNEREFELEIAVLGRLLDIRTLEEKRERVE